jgi:signal transduction histidine kinase
MSWRPKFTSNSKSAELHMDQSSAEGTARGNDEVPEQLLQLREAVFERWKECVWAKIPEAKELDERVLTSALLRFYDDLVTSLRKGSPYSITAPDIGSSYCHGRERATSTKYGPKELLQELQLLRQAVFEVSDKRRLKLLSSHRSIISRSIETAELSAVHAFSVAQKEVSEIFITSLSHDLRNPLSVATASAQLIESKANEESITVLAQRVRKKLGEIDAMIQTLLDAAVLKGRRKLRLKISGFEMKKFAEEVSADMASAHQPILCDGEPVSGYWCPASMRRVLENLLANAMKYGSPCTPVKLHIGKVAESVVIEVHNEGVPIPENERDLLFCTFHRFDEIDVKGWGLGLPLVQLVAESHGGTVDVLSTEQAGTTFKIMLPIDCRAKDASRKESQV